MSTQEILNELNNNVYAVLNIFGVEIWITQTLVSLWVAMALIIIFAIVVKVNMNKWSDKPKGLQNIAELLVEIFDNYVKTTMGNEFMFLGNYFFGVVLIIFIMNLSGLWLLRPATADISTTAGLALVSFLLIHALGIIKGGKEYFKAYAKPFFVMIPLNIISEIAIPLSLAFRLFGSTVGGYIITTLFYSLMPIFLKFGFPMILHGYFDVFAGSLQAFIFLTLSMTFIRDKCPE